MAYVRRPRTPNTLISRAGYSGFGALQHERPHRTGSELIDWLTGSHRGSYGPMGSWTDTIGDIGKGALTFFGQQQQAVGAAQQANLDLQTAVRAQSSGMDSDTLLVGAAVIGVAAFLILRKKKAAS